MSSLQQTITGKTADGRGKDTSGSGAALWTVAQVADMLRVSKMTIYRMVHSGELGHVRLGRRFRIPDTELRSILVERPRHMPALRLLP